MAIVLYYLDTLTQKFRSVGGPDLTPASSSPGIGGYGQIAYDIDPYGSPQ